VKRCARGPLHFVEHASQVRFDYQAGSFCRRALAFAERALRSAANIRSSELSWQKEKQLVFSTEIVYRDSRGERSAAAAMSRIFHIRETSHAKHFPRGAQDLKTTRNEAPLGAGRSFLQ